MSVPPESVTPPESSTGSPPPPAGAPSAEEKQWAMFAHLSALLGGLVTGWFGGWGWFLGPLIIWLVKKDTMPFVNDQAKEALNFNITVAIIFVILYIFSVLSAIVTLGLSLMLFVPLMLIIGVAALVFIILAAIKANEGVAYRYPFALRLIK